MLGERIRFDAVPFFWSQHYDVTIRYVGHAERWDGVEGSLDARDATVSFLRNGRRFAAATVSRDRALESVRRSGSGTWDIVARKLCQTFECPAITYADFVELVVCADDRQTGGERQRFPYSVNT